MGGLLGEAQSTDFGDVFTRVGVVHSQLPSALLCRLASAVAAEVVAGWCSNPLEGTADGTAGLVTAE